MEIVKAVVRRWNGNRCRTVVESVDNEDKSTNETCRKEEKKEVERIQDVDIFFTK